jgi:tetratricopeptide (TPR) repeat protein
LELGGWIAKSLRMRKSGGGALKRHTDTAMGEIIAQARHLLQRNLFWEVTELLTEYGAQHDLSGEALNILGIAWSLLEEYAKARDAFERAIGKRSKAVDFHYNYAMLLRRMGLFEEAMDEINTVLYLNPQHAPSLKLQRLLQMHLQDKSMHTVTEFKPVKRDMDPSSAWYGIVCQFCGANNAINARVCTNCGSVLDDAPPIIPVE